MKAMVLAAGLGTRLRPLTDDRPKALVELGGRALLEITLARLREAGVGEVVVNVHHLADLVTEYLNANHNFGMRIEISREDDLLLDTGGGLKKAAWFFLEDGDDKPFLLHNVDVVSAIDLGRMVLAHKENGALATLAVQRRESSRYLLFDERGELCGRQRREEQLVRQAPQRDGLAFCGIHVISTRMLRMMREEGVFSIIDSYLRLAGAGEKIKAFRADEYYWRDLGTAESLRRAEEDLRQGVAK
ncbi:MAG TPA: nucleotidyltransferase family protein [Terriglobales bacterium]|nr:nucleotidyltransferase family protein [Terriglobales bacterium]